MIQGFRNSLMFGFLLVLAAMASCSKDEPVPEPELTTTTGAFTFLSTGEIKFFHVKSNLDWTVSSSENWLTLSTASGQSGTTKIDVTATANTVTSVRTATITVMGGTLAKQITISQAGADILTVDEDEIEVETAGEEVTLAVQSSGTYTVTVNADWIIAAAGTTTAPKFSIITNPSMVTRQGKITFRLNNLARVVTVTQTGNPFTIAADNTGMGDEAFTLASKMKLGWNLGNALESNSVNNGVYTASETMWGNPQTTKALIDAVKGAGFNTIRIPCAWSGYIENQTTFKIKDKWLTRVKEVVDYCVDNDMYAIINIHWDGGWLENNPTYSSQVQVNRKQKALWEQIAVAFREYDQHLLFAGTNEVHADYGTPTAEHIEVQQSYLQTFIDAVRSTGGRNAYRNLIVQGYNTNIEHTKQNFTMPVDVISNRVMAEVHFYDPYDFTLDINSTKYFWGVNFAGNPNTPTWGQEAWVDAEFAKMKVKFIDNNIPVILGEYAVTLRATLTGTNYTNHIASRNYYLNYVTKAALQNGMVPVYWDNGGIGNNASGIFNRNNNTVAHPDALQAIVSALE